jgi:hypothetical protein
VSVTAGCSYLKGLIRRKSEAPLWNEGALAIAPNIVVGQGRISTSAYQTHRITVLCPMTRSSIWHAIVTVPSFLALDDTGIPV